MTDVSYAGSRCPLCRRLDGLCAVDKTTLECKSCGSLMPTEWVAERLQAPSAAILNGELTASQLEYQRRWVEMVRDRASASSVKRSAAAQAALPARKRGPTGQFSGSETKKTARSGL